MKTKFIIISLLVLSITVPVKSLLAKRALNPKSAPSYTKPREVLKSTAIAGSTIELHANGSNDPDGDSLIYSWSFYEEPSSYDGTLAIQNRSSEKVNLEIPEDAAAKDIHILLEIHDDGTPSLNAYRRMIIHVES
ncbi:PKD domain-containing protein [Cyclobacterium salsum]|uniref:PKD domain-containing protein n=1 Tax=Cyclobacterium salsum TaxID=2666329 RepID=UPI001390D52D|nr:PKD domain-containing protein [Cyclobacterium salsum]